MNFRERTNRETAVLEMRVKGVVSVEKLCGYSPVEKSKGDERALRRFGYLQKHAPWDGYFGYFG